MIIFFIILEYKHQSYFNVNEFPNEYLLMKEIFIKCTNNDPNKRPDINELTNDFYN